MFDKLEDLLHHYEELMNTLWQTIRTAFVN